MSEATIRFLYTNIGRGHPFYLDGIVDALKARESTGLRVEQTPDGWLAEVIVDI